MITRFYFTLLNIQRRTYDNLLNYTILYMPTCDENKVDQKFTLILVSTSLIGQKRLEKLVSTTVLFNGISKTTE